MTVIHDMTREQRRDIDWAKYEAGYNAAYDEALTQRLCFCTCGCKEPGVIGRHPLTGEDVPARCDACRKGNKAEHDVIRPPVETFDWAAYEDPEPPKQPRRRVGNVDRQLREALADAKDDLRAAMRTVRGERRASKEIDINRVVIPADVVGPYLVRDDGGGWARIDIDRPVKGPEAGFVLVQLKFGDSVVQHGLQYPQPYREVPGYAQTYRGPFAHLIKRLVDDPGQARADFEEAQAWEGVA